MGAVSPAVVGTDYDIRFPRMVWDGTGYGMVWQEGAGTGGGGVRFARLSEEGIFDRGSIQSLTTLDLAGLPRVAFSGSEYAVTFYASGTGRFADAQAQLVRLDRSGKLIAGSTVSLPKNAPQSRTANAAIAWNPVAGEWGLTWMDSDGSGSGSMTLAFARYSAAGALVPGSQVAVRSDRNLHLSPVGGSPFLWTGSGYAVVYVHSTTTTALELVELNDRGMSTGRRRYETAPNLATDATLAQAGLGYGIVYYSVPDGDIHFVRVTPAGFVAGSDLTLGPSGVAYASSPTIASDGTDYVAAWGQWQDERKRSVWVARISGAGVLRGAVQQLPPGSSDWGPSITWNGCRYALSYQAENVLNKGARVTFFRDMLP